MHNDSGLDKAQKIFKDIDFEKIDFSDLMGGWEDTSEDFERLPSVGWPDINNKLLVKMYFDGDGHYDIAVVSGGGVKERHEMEKMNEVNHLVIWLLVREDTIRKCGELINRKMDQSEIYTIIKKISESISAHGFVGGIEAGEMYYGGDVLIECLEYFGLDPYRKY